MQRTTAMLLGTLFVILLAAAIPGPGRNLPTGDPASGGGRHPLTGEPASAPGYTLAAAAQRNPFTEDVTSGGGRHPLTGEPGSGGGRTPWGDPASGAGYKAA